VQALGLVGARAVVVGPPTLVPRDFDALGCEISTDIAATADADVVYVLRIQAERMAPGEAYIPSLREYTALYGITPERVRPGQVVMHPGPMNRGIEIDPRVADSDAALVTDQVRAGLVVRMAVLYDLVAQPSAGRVPAADKRTAEIA
jgi:aspartate carbamoyltransferase catalytic subunit